MTPDNRKPFVFHGGMRSIQRLAEELLAFDLWAVGDRIFQFDEGTGHLLLINHDRLRGLIDAHLCGVRLIMRDGRYEKDCYQLDLRRQDLQDVIGELLKIAPTGPGGMLAKTLSPMERDHILQRLRTGEPLQSLAEAYSVPIAAIQQLRSAAAS